MEHRAAFQEDPYMLGRYVDEEPHSTSRQRDGPDTTLSPKNTSGCSHWMQRRRRVFRYSSERDPD